MRRRVFAGFVGEDFAGAVRLEVDGEGEAAIDVGDGEFVFALLALEDEAVEFVEVNQHGVGGGRIAIDEAELVETHAGANGDGEGAGHDLGVEAAAVAGGDVFEFDAVVGDEADENVEATGGGFRIGFGGDLGRESELFHEGDDVDAAFFEDGFLREVEGGHAELAELVFDGGVGSGQEAGLHAIGDGTEAEVERGGLDVFFRHRNRGVHVTVLEQHADILRRQDAGTDATLHGVGDAFHHDRFCGHAEVVTGRAAGVNP